MRISEAKAAYLRQRRQEGYSEATLKAYDLQLDLLANGIGDVEVADITTDLLRRHFDGFVDRLKPSSLAHKVRAVRIFFRWLHEDAEAIVRNPALKLREPKLGRHIPKAMTMDDVEAIRDACRTDFERALIEVFFATGCRIGEVMRMNRCDIDFDRRAIQVLGKGNAEREVYFGSKAAMRLRKYLSGRDDGEQALFRTVNRPYRRMQIHTLYHHIKRIAARSGVGRNITPHTWRHTLATLLINQGAPLESVQQLLGHVKPESTQLYAVLSGEKRHSDYKKYFAQ
jgi:integrase/recombinase XerD